VLVLKSVFVTYLLWDDCRRGFTIRLKRLKTRALDFGEPQNFGSKDNFHHFCKQLYLFFCFGSAHVFHYAANERSVLNRGPQTFSAEGHTSYYTAVRRSDILRNVIVSGYVTFYQIKKLFIIFSLLAKSFRGSDEMASRIGFGPQAVVWRPLA